jgi:hypothetical protein
VCVYGRVSVEGLLVICVFACVRVGSVGSHAVEKGVCLQQGMRSCVFVVF